MDCDDNAAGAAQSVVDALNRDPLLAAQLPEPCEALCLTVTPNNGVEWDEPWMADAAEATVAGGEVIVRSLIGDELTGAVVVDDVAGVLEATVAAGEVRWAAPTGTTTAQVRRSCSGGQDFSDDACVERRFARFPNGAKWWELLPGDPTKWRPNPAVLAREMFGLAWVKSQIADAVCKKLESNIVVAGSCDDADVSGVCGFGVVVDPTGAPICWVADGVKTPVTDGAPVAPQGTVGAITVDGVAGAPTFPSTWDGVRFDDLAAFTAAVSTRAGCVVTIAGSQIQFPAGCASFDVDLVPVTAQPSITVRWADAAGGEHTASPPGIGQTDTTFNSWRHMMVPDWQAGRDVSSTHSHYRNWQWAWQVPVDVVGGGTLRVSATRVRHPIAGSGDGFTLSIYSQSGALLDHVEARTIGVNVTASADVGPGSYWAVVGDMDSVDQSADRMTGFQITLT